MNWQSEGEPADGTSRDTAAPQEASSPDEGAQEPAAGAGDAREAPEHESPPEQGEAAGEEEDLAARYQRLSVDYQALSDEHQRLQESHRQLRDSMLRLQADFDNYRRRTREEAARLGQEGAHKVIVDLLPVVDNLERALQAAEAESGGNPSEGAGAAAVESIRSGVAMILQQLRRVLENYGVEPVPGVGEPFDPRWHEAVAREEPEAGEGSGGDGREAPSDGPLVVVEEFQKGYRAGDKVLRASMVKVGMERKVQPG